MPKKIFNSVKVGASAVFYNRWPGLAKLGIEPGSEALTTVGYLPNSEDINRSKLHFIEKMAILQYLRAIFLNEKVNYLRAI